MKLGKDLLMQKGRRGHIVDNSVDQLHAPFIRNGIVVLQSVFALLLFLICIRVGWLAHIVVLL